MRSDRTRLQRLADLHERGALSDEEFSAAKARVLGG
ncbi:MAG: SHOCT domain-containing protein [Steroidobacteraceae bacterium]